MLPVPLLWPLAVFASVILYLIKIVLNVVMSPLKVCLASRPDATGRVRSSSFGGLFRGGKYSEDDVGSNTTLGDETNDSADMLVPAAEISSEGQLRAPKLLLYPYEVRTCRVPIVFEP